MNNEWVEGFYLISPEFDDVDISVITAIEPRHPHYVFKKTVRQFTGLTDKNGKKIFEGDILLVKTTLDSFDKATRDEEYTANGVVVFNDGHFELKGKGLMLYTYYGVKLLFMSEHFKKYEVIGNIHDNPELLKGGKKE